MADDTPQKPEGKKKEPTAKEPTVQEKQQEDPKDATIKDLVDNLQRLQAEFENYKKRLEQEQERFCEAANAGFIESILPTLDQFGLALASEKNRDGFYKGVELIYTTLFDTLARHGLARMETEGKKFDPRLHEALLTEVSEKDNGTVLEEIQRGYLLHGRVLRHAKVKIAQKGKPNKEGTPGKERGEPHGNPKEHTC